jgi:branched-chain amino acid transport system permease protein
VRAANARWAAVTAGAVVLVVLPFVLPQFYLVQIGIKTLWLGTAAASLTFLIRYGGMVSLAQTGIYGSAGYVVASLTVDHQVNAVAAAVLAVAAATGVALAIGLIAARTEGIYFLMLTLAAGVFLYYFALGYQPFTHGHGGINGVTPPTIGGVSFRDPANFYFLAVAVAIGSALALHAFVRTPIGLAMQGVRDAPRRMEALGFRGAVVRVAAFSFAGTVAGAAGVLAVWYNGQISPGSIDVTRTIDVLVVAVIGGITRIEGAWLGALAATLLANFASDYTDRYNTLIGAVFVAVVLLSPTGIAGGLERLGALARRASGRHLPPAPEPTAPDHG